MSSFANSTPALRRRERTQARLIAVLAFLLILPVEAEDSGRRLTVNAPDGMPDIDAQIKTVVIETHSELLRGYGLVLPQEIHVDILPPGKFGELKPGGKDIRYDGLAAASSRYVAVSTGYIGRPRLRLAEILRHELFHVAAGPLRLPRWFDEGLAMSFSGGFFPVGAIEAPTKRDPVPPVDALDLEFASADGRTVRDAYSDSYLFTRYLLEQVGRNAVKALLKTRRKAPEEDFQQQFHRVTGRDLDVLFRDYSSRHSTFLWRFWLLARQLPLFTWVFIILAVVLVIGGLSKWRRYKSALEKEEPGDEF